MGFDMSAAMEIIAKMVPVLTPICLTSEICAIMLGNNETNAPEPKPKRAAKTMIGALVVEGSHMARTRIPKSDVSRTLASGMVS